MSAEKPAEVRGTCFVVMGFGTKTDYQSEPIRRLNLDKTYQDIIKPAVTDAKLKCKRADEIVQSGLIDLAMYEQLLSADVVVADLSTSNSNAFYELGVRHALKPYTTIVICEDGLTKEGRDKLPFDVNHVTVRKYHHLGEDIGYGEVIRFRKVLTDAINEILSKHPPDSDSPVYTFIKGLNPPERVVEKAGQDLNDALGGGEKKPEAKPLSIETHSELMRQAEDAQKRGDFDFAKAVLGAISKMRPEDSFITQRLVVATFKGGDQNKGAEGRPARIKAYEEALELLKPLRPEVSSDPWTLGLWGTVQEKLWKETGDSAHLNEALNAYSRSFSQRRDYFNGIHEAFLRNVSASVSTDRAEAITDFVLARRIRRDVIPICEEWLKSTQQPSSDGNDNRALNEYLEEKSWVLATIAEAYLGTGDDARAEQYFAEAEAVIRQLEANSYPAFKVSRMRESTQQKRAELQSLLAASPLQYVKTE